MKITDEEVEYGTQEGLLYKNKILSQTQARHVLNMSDERIRSLIKKELIPYTQINRSKLFLLSDLIAFAVESLPEEPKRNIVEMYPDYLLYESSMNFQN